jgi:hypothetical protein
MTSTRGEAFELLSPSLASRPPPLRADPAASRRGAFAAALLLAASSLGCRRTEPVRANPPDAGVLEPAPQEAAAAPPIPAPPVQGPLVVSFACSFSTLHMGGAEVGRITEADLGAAKASYREWKRSRDDLDLARRTGAAGVAKPGPNDRTAKLSPTDLARLDRLARDVAARTSWPLKPAVVDGEACSLSVVDGAGNAIVSVQRQTGEGDDAPAALIRALQALPLREK